LSGAPEVFDADRRIIYVKQIVKLEQAGYVSFELEEKTARALEGLAQRHGTYVVCGIDGSRISLGRSARQDDVVIGFPVAGRSVTEVQDLVGFFVNTLVLRLNLEGVLTGDELVERVETGRLGCACHIRKRHLNGSWRISQETRCTLSLIYFPSLIGLADAGRRVAASCRSCDLPHSCWLT